MAFSWDDLNQIMADRAGIANNALKNSLQSNPGAMDAARAQQASAPASSAASSQYATPLPYSSDTSQNTGSSWQGMAGVGSHVMDGVDSMLNWLAKPFTSAGVLATDAGNKLTDIAADLFGNTSHGFDGSTIYPRPNPSLSDVGQQLHDIWTSSNAGKQSQIAADAVGSGNNFTDNLEGFLSSMILPGEALTAPLGAAAKLGVGGVGRIPAIANKADDFARMQAGKAFDATPAAAKAPEVDPFATTHPDMGTNFGNDIQAPKTADDFMNHADVLQNATPPMENPKLLDQYLTQHLGDHFSPEELQGLGYNDKVDLANAVKPDVQTKLAQQMADNENLANRGPNMGPTDPSTYGTPIADPAALSQQAQNAIADARDKYIMNQVSQMTPGEKLTNMFNGKVVDPIGDRLRQVMFANGKGFGSGINLLPEPIRNAILNNRGALTSNAGKLDEWGRNVAQDASKNGMNLDSLDAARNRFEAGQAGTSSDPAHAYGDQLMNYLNHAQTHGVGDVQAGLNAEKAAGVGTNTELDNYLHMAMKPQSLWQALKGDARSGVTQGYNKERQFQTAAQAQQAGYDVHNPIYSAVDRLKESNKDLHNIDLHQQLYDLGKQHGLVSDNPVASNKNFVEFNSQYPKSALNGKYVDPAMAKYLSGLERVPLSQRSGMLGAGLRTFDRTQDLYRYLNLYNPMVHNHNIMGNALLSYGLDPAHYANAEATIGGKVGSRIGKSLGGQVTPEMQDSLDWANKTGALGAQHNNINNQIERILAGKNPDSLRNQFNNAALWNRERAMRLGVFHQARQEAMAAGHSAEDAANMARDVTNKHLGDYSSNNLSPMEQELMTRLDPFYRWHKSNYPMQLGKLVNPGAMIRTDKFDMGRNTVNQMATGHSQADNIGDDKQKNIDIQFPLGGGKFASLDPYSPTDEPRKILDSKLGEFLWGRTFSPAREAMQQITNNRYAPFEGANADGKEYRAHIPITSPADSTSEWWGNRAQHAIDSLAPNLYQTGASAAGIGRQGADVPAWMRAAAGATGGFMSPTPKSQQSEDIMKKAELNYMQKALKQKLRQQGGK